MISYIKKTYINAISSGNMAGKFTTSKFQHINKYIMGLSGTEKFTTSKCHHINKYIVDLSGSIRV